MTKQKDVRIAETKLADRIGNHRLYRYNVEVLAPGIDYYGVAGFSNLEEAKAYKKVLVKKNKDRAAAEEKKEADKAQALAEFHALREAREARQYFVIAGRAGEMKTHTVAIYADSEEEARSEFYRANPHAKERHISIVRVHKHTKLKEFPGGPWTRHGHAVAGVTVEGTGRPAVARCGGPKTCKECAIDAAQMQKDVEK